MHLSNVCSAHPATTCFICRRAKGGHLLRRHAHAPARAVEPSRGCTVNADPAHVCVSRASPAVAGEGASWAWSTLKHATASRHQPASLPPPLRQEKNKHRQNGTFPSCPSRHGRPTKQNAVYYSNTGHLQALPALLQQPPPVAIPQTGLYPGSLTVHPAPLDPEQLAPEA